MLSLLALLGPGCIIGPINRYAQESVAVLPDVVHRGVVAFIVIDLANCAVISMGTTGLDNIIATY